MDEIYTEEEYWLAELEHFYSEEEYNEING